MKRKKRISMLLVLLLLVFMLWYAMEDALDHGQVAQEVENETTELEVWYSDEQLQEYMESAAKSFEANNHIKVKLRLLSELDYIEEINNKSVGEEFQGPDVYLVTNDQLEMVELAGLTKKVKNSKQHYTNENYCDTALHAVR